MSSTSRTPLVSVCVPTYNGADYFEACLDSALDQRLKDLEVVDRSGSHAVDETLVDALREAAFDQNPPGEAANQNGEFEFVFQAQLSAGVEPGADGPRLRTIESRLRVGLL